MQLTTLNKQGFSYMSETVYEQNSASMRNKNICLKREEWKNIRTHKNHI